MIRWREELKQLVYSTITVKDPDDVWYAQGTAAERRRSNKLYDIEIRTATALFQRYRTKTSTPRRQQRQIIRKEEIENGGGGGGSSSSALLVLHVVSDLGVSREIDSAYELAQQLLLPVLEDACRSHGLSHHVRVAPQSGFVCVVTVHLMRCIIQQQQQQQQADLQRQLLSPCPKCPVWCSGSKGLWWHLQQQHGALHNIATETATYQLKRDCTAMVVYQQHQHQPQLSSAVIADVVCDPRRNDAVANTANATATTVPNLYTNTQQEQEQMVVGKRQREESPLPEQTSTAVASPKNQEPEDDPWSCVKRGSLQGLQDCLARINNRSRSDTTKNHRETTNGRFDCRTATDRHGAVLLHWAAGGGHVATVRYLVETAGCDPAVPQRGRRAFAGRTALHWAARHGRVCTVRYLLEHAAAAAAAATVVRVGGEEGASSSSSSVTAVARLLEAVTVDGTTAFCWAAWQGHLTVMQLLHSYGCKTETTNHFGCNAVLWAAQGCGDAALFEWLEGVGCGPLLHSVNHSGHGLLHKAAQRGRRDLCEWFLVRRLFAWFKDCKRLNDDATSIMTVLGLVGPDNDGCTPSDLAGMEDHEELAVYLAEQERALVIAAVVSSSSSSSTHISHPTPDWLTPLKGAHSCVANSNQLSWEPWAGVFRMRSVLPNNS